MIIKLHRSGRSFKGVVRYLTHDAGKKDTSERLAWTHTLNLANDHVASAVDEMIWTARSADLLKREAGVSTSGSKLKAPVKHFSLSWHASETPTREEMIEVTKRYLKHMAMDDRQAILFSHNDTAHAHVHVVANVISPIDGRALNTGFEYRRTQAFALAYERETGRVFCEERLKPEKDREKSPNRSQHEDEKKSEKKFAREEAKRFTEPPGYFERHDDKTFRNKEWEALKSHQKAERQEFYADGKKAFRDASKEAYRKVRQEFRGQWNAHYAAKRAGGDPFELASTKAALLEAQKKALDERREAAIKVLMEQREKQYEAVLAQQQVDRDALRDAQRRGERTYRMFDVIYPAPEAAVVQTRRPGEAGPWRTDTMPDAAEIAYRFERSRSMFDPVEAAARGKPAVVSREKPRDDEARSAGEEKRGGFDRPAPRNPHMVEMTENRVEAKRIEKAREMTDGEREKQKNEDHLIIRASWNRRRGYRGRGD